MNAFFIAPAISGASLEHPHLDPPVAGAATRAARPDPGRARPSDGLTVGFWDALRGARRTSGGEPRLALHGAQRGHHPEAAAGLRPTGVGAVCFRAAEGAAFASTQDDIVELLDADGDGPDVEKPSTSTASPGWSARHPDDVSALCTDLHAVNPRWRSRASAPGCCARSSPSTARATGGSGLVYLYKQGTFYPFGPLASPIEKKTKEFTFFILALEAAMLGVFVSLDLFLFYVFWEAMLIPMYFLIGIWGDDRRIYAAIKFMLYTMAGSVLMLVAILGLAYLHSEATGSYSFDYLKLLTLQIAPATQYWFFLAFALAFAIKVPMFPFHTWLPDAHVEAPTAGSVILAGVLLKMGTYGLIRFAFPLFPDAAAHFAPMLAVLAVIGIVYGALVAMVQPDMKKLVAYSSVSHLGFVVLGICAWNMNGLQGAVYQMVATV